MSNSKTKVLLFITPFVPKYGVMNIISGWFENYDYDKFDITLACYCVEKEELLDKMKNYPQIEIIELPNLASFKYFYIPQILSLNRLFKSKKFDIIHSIFIQADIIASILKSIYNIPLHVSSIMGQLISKVYGNAIIQKIKRLTYRLTFKLFCSNIDCYFPITETSLFQISTDFGLAPKKSVVIYSGVPLDFRNRNLTKSVNFNIGVASQLIFEKGIDIVIEALNDIKGAIPNVKLFVAGHGSEKSNLIELASLTNVIEDVVFLDFVVDMPEFMASLDLFIFPARPSYDGLPRVILEAMIQKTPVIASDTPEIREIINLNTINGILFEVGNSLSLFEKVKYVIQNQLEIDRIVNNAFNMACSISVIENVKTIQNTYASLLSKHNRFK